MKRLHLVTALFSSRGHGFEYIRNFCTHLGNDFDILLHIASKKKIETPENIRTHYTQVDYSKTDAKNFVKYYKFAPYVRAIAKQRASYRYYKKIVQSNLIGKEDIVFIMDYDVAPLRYLVGRLNNGGVKNIFLWVHSAKFQSKDLLYTLYKSFFKLIFKNVIGNKIKGVIVNGEYIRNEIITNLSVIPDNVHVIQYPSEIPFKMIPKDKARKKIGLNVDENIVLFFGMLRKDKNIEFTIKSAVSANSSPKLIIAGSEASITEKDIKRWLLKYNTKNYLLDIDYISEEKMALYFSASDLLILTYELESGSQSGPLSLAREFELPALVTKTGEIGKYVIDNNVGFAADKKKENEFSETIDNFFDLSKEEKDHLKESLILAKEKYSWKSAKAKYLNIFND